MPFDASTAQPEQSGEFDASTAMPDQQSAPASTAAAPQDHGGFWRNVGAGLEEAPGAILDMLKSHGTAEMVGGPNDPQLWNDPDIATPVTRAIGKATGLQPEDVGEDGFADKAGRFIGASLPALLAPETEEPAVARALATRLAPARLANAPLATTLRRSATLAGAGAGSAAGQEAAGDDNPMLQQAASVLGAIAGGGAAELPSMAAGAARRAASSTGKWARPLTAAGRDQMAADTLRNAATDPHAALSNLDTGNDEIVTGSKPTTFQQTGDMGLGGLERSAAAKNPALFNQRRADQNAARTAALASIQHGGDADAVGTFLRGQFRNFDDQTQQHIDTLTAQAQQQAETLGGNGHPEEHGAALRDAIQQAEDAARTRERSLWQAVDPDRNLVIPTQPTATAAKEIAGSLSPSAKPMEGEEKSIFDVAGNYGAQMPFADLSDLRSRTSAAMRQELLQNGATPAYARLSRLRGAIQDNIAAAATGQATQDAENVSRGTIVPGQALTSKIQGWVNDFYGTRAQSSAASGDGAVRGAASRPANAAVPDGTGLSPPGESGNPPGNSGVPQGPQPFDQPAADRLAAATQATKDRAGTFGQSPVKQVLAKAGTQDAYRLPQARVPEKFFHAGPTSFQDIQGLRQAVGDGAADTILTDYAASSLRRAAERPDGTLDPRKVAAWQQRYGNALRAFPGLNERFSTAAGASDAIAGAAAARREAILDRNSSAIGKVMNAQNADDVTKTVGSIFGKNNATQAMGDLAAAAAKSPEAKQGLRQAVADHITRNFISNTEAGTSGANLIKSDAFQSFLKKNRGALAQVFAPEEMAVLDRIGADLKRANRSIAAVKLPGGSNTVQDLAAVAAHDPNATVLDRALSEAAAAGGGAVVAHATGAGLGWMGAKVANAFRAAGLKKVDDLVTEAMLNPEIARDLLRKAPPMPDSGQSVALASRLRRIAISAAATRLGSRQNNRPAAQYAKGGRAEAA